MSRHHNARALAAARRWWRPWVEAGTATCARCEQPIRPGQPWDVGHVHDLGLGGDPAGPTRPEHARKRDCPAGGNRAAGARLGNQLRPRGRRRLADWLSIFWERVATQPRAAFVFLPANPGDFDQVSRKIYGTSAKAAKA